MSTFMANKDTVKRSWYVLDAAGKPLGKTAALAADLLRGKLKPDFTHSGYPGGFHQVQYKTLMQDKPELAMRLAVRGMLQKNSIARAQLRRLKIYRGAEHKHEAQKPVAWER